MANFLDDLDSFFDSGEFAVSVVWSGFTITGQLGKEYATVGDGDNQMSSSVPILTVKASEVVGLGYGDPITVDAAPYTVVEIQPDGSGLVDLVLNDQ